VHVPTGRLIHAVPIPGPSSRIHRPVNQTSEGNTPLSHSPSSAESQFPFSPTTNPSSSTSPHTNITSPPSSFSFTGPNLAPTYSPRTLSYPSVPPPSLSSSFGSPSVPYHLAQGERSPNEVSRRSSGTRRGSDWRVTDVSVREVGAGDIHSRRSSVERGARVAETGTLIPRSRASSHSFASAARASDTDINGITTDSTGP